MRSGRPPTLWCDLIVTDGPPVKETDLDHVGIERALGEEFDRPAAVGGDLLGLALEGLDEQPADRLALELRLGDAFERAEERSLRRDMDQRDVEMAAKQPHHLLALSARIRPWSTKTQVSWSPIASWISTAATAEFDAAGKAADHPALADLGADRLARLGAERRHRPVALQPRDLVDEIADQPRAVGRVHDFGMEHQAVIAARLVGDQRVGRVLRSRDAREARRQAGDAVAMAHPDDVALARLPHALEQRARVADLDLGAAEFAVVAALDAAAELLGHAIWP